MNLRAIINNKLYPLPLNGLLNYKSRSKRANKKVYIYIVTIKVHVSTTLLLSIFVTYPKEKMKENDFFFFFEKFGYAWGTHAEVSQEYKYSKIIRYGYGSIFGVPVLHI